MHKILYICDHCGKELDDRRDYTDMKIDNFIDYVKTDLCSECFRKLNDIILEYTNKKKSV